MSALRIVVLALATSAGCTSPCGDPIAPPELARSYAARTTAGTSIHDATVVVDGESAVLEYTAPDGRRWRARYAITERTTRP